MLFLLSIDSSRWGEVPHISVLAVAYSKCLNNNFSFLWVFKTVSFNTHNPFHTLCLSRKVTSNSAYFRMPDFENVMNFAIKIMLQFKMQSNLYLPLGKRFTLWLLSRKSFKNILFPHLLQLTCHKTDFCKQNTLYFFFLEIRDSKDYN